uniref:Mitochondrial ribosomal protein S18A n=1 Tax=Plectus sambesii TaxID=2011161 RepID=A0A914WLG3_9BILA
MSLLLRVLRVLPPASAAQSAALSTSTPLSLRKIQETVEGKTTTVEVVDVQSDRKQKLIPVRDEHCSCPLCRLAVKVSYEDVLILEQFMRKDGTVLPKQLTGLCFGQQLRLERCVMQAHWCGLFPDRTLPGFDRTGYKKYARYWSDDMDMYRLKHNVVKASWFYVKRYDVGKGRPYPKIPANSAET